MGGACIYVCVCVCECERGWVGWLVGWNNGWRRFLEKRRKQSPLVQGRFTRAAPGRSSPLHDKRASLVILGKLTLTGCWVVHLPNPAEQRLNRRKGCSNKSYGLNWNPWNDDC